MKDEKHLQIGPREAWYGLCVEDGVDLPITCAVYDLCYGESEEDCRGRCLKLLAKLFARDTKSEFYS